MLKKHVFGSFNLNKSEKHRLSFEDIFLGNTRHLYEKNEPTLGSSGGGVHGKVSGLIAYKAGTLIGYEPAGPTMHPPQNDRGWVHFFR